MQNKRRRVMTAGLIWALLFGAAVPADRAIAQPLEAAFDQPPQSTKPWVYWYFMDGHITREGLTKDLEAMKKAGIGGAIFLTINAGTPKPPHPVEFMSPEWQDLYAHMVKEADRLGIAISLGIGPGWAGDGGPWLKPEETMQHLVASVTPVTGGKSIDVELPQPKPREPFFGRASMANWMVNTWLWFYRDVSVVAYPTPKSAAWVPYADEKALYYRAPYSSAHNVRPFFDAPAEPAAVPADACLDQSKMIDVTDKLDKDGRLRWDAPAGDWTVYRFGRTLTGQNTRPSPSAGLGFESDKFSAAAFAAHAKAFLQPLIDRAGKPSGPDRGLTTLHLDSWEMGAQNWTEDFRQQFQKRRGYDPLPYLPALLGRYVTDAATTERFLWDIRQTGRELIHDGMLVPLRDYAHAHGLRFTCEGYDMNPAGDLMALGSGDVQMGEFWSKGFGFSTEFSVFEATSAAHTKGQPIVGTESFTAGANERWQQYPGSMKSQGDWALAAGVNWFVFHRYQHQPKEGEFPGMRMGHWGVSWERTQTWWDMVPAYHQYLARASAVLQQGVSVADVLYLAPEGAPHVFRAPASATVQQGGLPDRRGYNFDGVDPDRLMDAAVTDGRVTFPGGASYAVLVLPKYDTMTLPLLRKVKALLDDGATVIGERPLRTPSFGTESDDAALAALSGDMWKDVPAAGKSVGRGLLIDDHAVRPAPAPADPLTGAKWIVADGGGTPKTGAFQAKFNVPSLAGVESAELALCSAGAFRVEINGQDMGGQTMEAIARPERVQVRRGLKEGENVLAITVKNAGSAPGSAALVGTLTLRSRDGRTTVFRSNEAWLSSAAPADAKKKSKALVDPPAAWPIPVTAVTYDELYVPYDVTAALLQSRGLPPDFEADVPIRYTHRHDGENEIYFVANTADAAVDASCTFRVSGHAPEWWDPITGQRRSLPQYREVDGRTTLSLHFGPSASGFVVFRRGATNAPANATNIPKEQTLASINGPWDVAFDPKWGGPAKVKFDKLEDWSQRPEPGIRFYSGTAVYRTSFDAPKDAGKANVLSLGDVHAMARVRLNGRDLGVAWCAPWSVVLPADLLRPSGNDLEITVANLWINRLIGDAGLTEAKRLTKTSDNPYKASDKLQPSGLLGPVQLRLITE